MTSRRVRGKRDAFLRPTECDTKTGSATLCGNECYSFLPLLSHWCCLDSTACHHISSYYKLYMPRCVLCLFLYLIMRVCGCYTASHLHYTNTNTCNKYVVLYFHNFTAFISYFKLLLILTQTILCTKPSSIRFPYLLDPQYDS